MSTTALEIPGYVAGTYTIDPGHSDVAFSVRHMMVSKVRGHFTRFQGELALASDPLASTVTATIDLTSIWSWVDCSAGAVTAITTAATIQAAITHQRARTTSFPRPANMI